MSVMAVPALKEEETPVARTSSSARRVFIAPSFLARAAVLERDEMSTSDELFDRFDRSQGWLALSRPECFELGQQEEPRLHRGFIEAFGCVPWRKAKHHNSS